LARSLSSYQVAISGNRVVWNEPDPILCGSDCEPKVLKTVVLGSVTVTQVDAVAIPGSSIRDIDLSGTQTTWVKTDTEGHVLTEDLTVGGPPVQVDAAPSPIQPTSSARVDGT